jgi:CheY-like chemotaxis protein
MARLRQEAERASQAKDEFLAVLGHELRNPLAPILTALDLMRLRGGDQPDRERTVIERQVQHVVRLVDDLLDVSRITRGQLELQKQRIELSEIVARAIEMASPLLEQRRHHLRVEVAHRGLLLDADPERLAQVLSNLVSNAAKYTEPGGRIAVSAAAEEGQIAIRVRDTGIGIAPEMLARVFEIFVQERQALDRSQGGLGLGLAIVRSLVHLHGGTIAVRSEGRDRGTEFVVHLPAARATVEPDASSAESRLRPEGGRPGRRILLVDDNQDAVEMLAGILEALGHSTCVAHDGPEALKLAPTFEPEVALVDIGLPVMDGYELARRLQAGAGERPLRLVAITGYGQPNDRQRSRAAGFDAHVVKPVNLDRLEAMIDELTVSHAAVPG